MNDFQISEPDISIPINGREYKLAVKRNVTQPPNVPRLLITSYLPTHLAWLLLKVCLKSLREYTTTPVEIWVIDNNSPLPQAERLLDLPDVNLVFNRTEPLPPDNRNWYQRWKQKRTQQDFGSYANAIGLELGTRLIDPKTEQILTLHMDTLVCHENWLPTLQQRLTDHVAAVGMRLDRTRTTEGVLHILGMLANFQRLKALKLNFFPDLPRYDVGDKVTIGFREAGFEIDSLPNTFCQPELVSQISPGSPFRNLQVDRTLDESGNVLFLHLGRGVKQSVGVVRKQTSPEQWVAFAETMLMRRRKKKGPTYAA